MQVGGYGLVYFIIACRICCSKVRGNSARADRAKVGFPTAKSAKSWQDSYDFHSQND